LLSALSVVFPSVFAGAFASTEDTTKACAYVQSNRAYRCENGNVIQFIAAGADFCPEQTIDLGLPCTNPQTGETMSWPDPDEAGCVWRTGTFCAGRTKIRYRCRDNSCRADRYDFSGWTADASPDGLIDGCFQNVVEEVSADCGGGAVEKSASAGGTQNQPLVVNNAAVSNAGYNYASNSVVQSAQSQTSNPYSGLSSNGYLALSGVSNAPPTGSNTPTLGGNSTEPGFAGFLMDYFQNLFDGVFTRNADLIHSRDVHDNPADAAYEHTVIMRDVLNAITQDLPSLVAAGVDAALGTGATLVSNLTGFVMGLIQANTGIEMPNLDFAGHMVLAAVAYSSGNIEEGNRQTALAVADLQGDIAGTEAAIMDAATRNQNQNNQPDRRSENDSNTVVAQNETNNGNQSGSENGNGTGEGSTASGDSGATGESGEAGGVEGGAGGGGAGGLGDDELEVNAV